MGVLKAVLQGVLRAAGGYFATLSSYTGQVATRSFMANVSSGTNNYANTRSAHITTETITSLQVKFPAWYTNASGVDTASTQNLVYTASIEYPAATFTQVKWAAATSVTAVAGSDTGLSDAITVSIPANTVFWVRNFCKTLSGSGGGIISTQATTSTRWVAQGEACALSATVISDLTMSGSVTDGGAGAFVYPLCIVGTTTRPSFFFHGDSRTIGTTSTGGSTAPDANGNMGQVAQSFGSTYGFINGGVGGTRISQANTGGGLRAALARTYCSHVINGFGINDLNSAAGNRTAAQVEGDFFIFTKMFYGLSHIACTISPVTTSSDGWVTTGNQTSDANSAAWLAVNAFLLTVPYTFKYCVDVASQTDSGNVWIASHTGDGLHCNAAGYAQIVSSAIFSPTFLSGLPLVQQWSLLSMPSTRPVLWMDFSNAAISPASGVPTTGGAGYTITGSVAPTYNATGFNGGPAYVFNGTTQGLLGSANVKSVTNGKAGFSLAALIQLTSNPAGSRAIWGATINGSNNERGIISCNSSGFPTLIYRRQDADAGTTITSGTQMSTSTPSLLVATLDAANNATVLTLNGVSVATGTFVVSGATTFTALDSNNVTVATLNALFIAMTGVEFVLVDSALSTANRQRLEGDIAWRHGVQATCLPSNHPYFGAPPVA